MKFYSDIFRKIRKSKRLSMEMVARDAGIARRTLSSWENNQNVPSKMKIKILANVLNVSINEISDIEPDHPTSQGEFSQVIKSWIALANSSTKERITRGNELIEKIRQQQNEVSQASIVIDAILSSIDSIFYVKDTKSKYITANLAFLKNLSLVDSYSVLGKIDSNFFSEKEAKENYDEDCLVLQTGIPIKKREGYIYGSRKKKWGLISKYPIFDSSERIAGIVCSIVDITERKKANQIRDLLDIMLEKTQDVISCEDHTNKCKLLYISETVKDLCGYPAQCFKDDAYFWVNNCVHPDYRDEMRHYRSTLDYPSRLVYKMICANGDEKWIEASALVKEIDGRKLVYFIERDVTKKKENNEIQEILEQFLGNIKDVVWLSVLNDKDEEELVYLSDSVKDIYGWPAEDFLNKKKFWADFIHPEDKTRLLKYKHEHYYPEKCQFRIMDKNGRKKWIEFKCSKKIIYGKVYLFERESDITAQMEYEEQKQILFEYANLLPKIIVWIAKINPDNTFEYHYLSDNIESITGYPKDKFIQKKFFYSSLISSEHLHFYREWIKTKKVPQEFKYKIVRADNVEIWIKTSISSRRNTKGEMLYFGTHTDITEHG